MKEKTFKNSASILNDKLQRNGDGRELPILKKKHLYKKLS
jgi:hypothetical protein